MPNGSGDGGAGALRGRRVLVTGATGFLGAHLARRLGALGAEVHALVRSAAAPAGTTPWRGDVTAPDSLRACVRGARPEAVFHLAADTAVRRFDGWDTVERSVAVNLVGTLNLLRACAEAATEAGAAVGAFVRVGGLEEYGLAPTPYAEAARERPTSPYSASQVATTHYCQALQAHLPFPVVTLRPALLYGPGQSTDFFIPALITSCLRGDAFAMSDGTQRRDLVYVDDAVDALVRASTTPGLAGAVVNVGSGEEYAIRDVAERIVRLTGGDARLLVGARPSRARDLEHLVTTTDLAAALLRWRARVSLDDGLRRTVAAFRGPASGAS